MSSQPEQIESVDSVAARLNTSPQKIVTLAGEKNVTRDWDGLGFVTWDVAGKVAKVVRAEQAKMDAEYIAQFGRDRQAVADMEEAALVRAAAQNKQSRVLGGTRVSLPGDTPEPDWMRDGAE